jgi:GT2 family glycosyltransferase
MTAHATPSSAAPSPYQPFGAPGSLATQIEPKLLSRITRRLDPRLTPTRSIRLAKRCRVAAVIPCYNRIKDVELLLGDLSRVDTKGIDLWVVVVDNASNVPLSTIPAPDNLRVEHLRLDTNTGGAGGFNAGMARVLAGEGLSAQFDPPDFVWLVDSDARIPRRCLRELLRAMLSRDDLAAVGSALVDPLTRQTYEIGGKLKPLNGYFVPAARGDVDRRFLVEAHYLAACSTLVRRSAIEKTGLMPDIFIHGDDVEWFLQMTAKTGMKVAGAPRSIAYHPLWSRKFQTWVRYYTTRNAYAPIDCCGFGALTRLYRASVDTARASAQSFMGLPELAELHLQGMSDAAQGRTRGHAPKTPIPQIVASTKVRPFAELAQAVRAELAQIESKRSDSSARLYLHPLMLIRAVDFPGLAEQAQILGIKITDSHLEYWRHRGLDTHRFSDTFKAFVRLLRPAAHDIAIVPTGWPTSWFRARTLIQLTSDGFLVRHISRPRVLRQAAGVLCRGLGLALKLAMRPRQVNPLPAAPARPALKLAHA